MRVSGPSTEMFIASLLLLPSLVSGLGYDCSNVRVEDTKFDLKELGGRHALGWVHQEEFTSKYKNTTFTFDICDTLSRQTDRDKKCPSGTHSKLEPTASFVFLPTYMLTHFQFVL